MMSRTAVQLSADIIGSDRPPTSMLGEPSRRLLLRRLHYLSIYVILYAVLCIPAGSIPNRSHSSRRTSSRQPQPPGNNDYDDYYNQQQQQQQQQQQLAGYNQPSRRVDVGVGVGSPGGDVIVPTIQCYSCLYHIEAGTRQGLDNCNDPFSPFEIPSVLCRGPCVKKFQKLEKQQDFTLTRGCLPSCRDYVSDTGYTECCSNNLCNGSSGTVASLRSICAVATGLLGCLVGIVIVKLLSICGR